MKKKTIREYSLVKYVRDFVCLSCSPIHVLVYGTLSNIRNNIEDFMTKVSSDTVYAEIGQVDVR